MIIYDNTGNWYKLVCSTDTCYQPVTTLLACICNAEHIDDDGQIQHKKQENRSQILDRMEKNKYLPAEPPKKEKVNPHLRAEKDVEVDYKAEVKSDHPDMTGVKAKNVHFYELFTC